VRGGGIRLDEQTVGRGQDREASRGMKKDLRAPIWRNFCDSEAPGERRLSNVRGYRDRDIQSGRMPRERGQGRKGGSVAPRETQTSFGESVCPIVEGSVAVTERQVCLHFVEGKVDPSGKKRLQCA